METAFPALSFEKVSADSEAQFIAHGRHTLVLRQHSALLVLGQGPSSETSSPNPALRIDFAGAHRRTVISGEEELPGRVYHARGDLKGPLLGNSTFRRVRYSSLYPGVDAVFYGNDRQLEFDFIVAPHADPSRIRLSLSSAGKITLQPSGDLALDSGGEQVLLNKPVIYQERDGVRTEIAGGYLLRDRSQVTFRLGKYDRSLPLIIDPSFTFGSPRGDEGILAFEANSHGETYVLGLTFDQANFPATLVQPGPQQQLSTACFLTKLNSSLTAPLYSILFDDLSCASAMALSPAGVPYLTGMEIAENTPVVLWVDDSSGTPVISHFHESNYGVSGFVTAMAVNSAGNVFLFGACRLVNAGDPALSLNGFNTQPDPAHDIYEAGCTGAVLDSNLWRQPLLTVYDQQGNLLYGSLLSPLESFFSSDWYALAADDAGRAYILGYTPAPVAVTSDAYQSQCAGTCPYLMVVNTAATGAASLVYSSYLWQTYNPPNGMAVRTGTDGSVYVAMAASVFGDYPYTAPIPPYQPFPFDDGSSGILDANELARFTLGSTGAPNQLQYALLFDPRVEVNGPGTSSTFSHWLSGLRLLPSGAVAVNTATGVNNTGAFDTDVVDIFFPSGQFRAPLIVNQLWNSNAAPGNTGQIAGDSSGDLYLARHVIQAPSTQADVQVALLGMVDPGSNTPPALQVPADFTVVATGETGAVVPYSVTAFDFEDGALAASCKPDSGAVFSIGDTQVICRVTDSGGLTAIASFIVTVTPPPPNTASGANVAVTPTNETRDVFLSQPLKLTFGQVSVPGFTSLKTRLDLVPPPPAGLQAGSPPTYFDVSTNAVFDASLGADLCLDIRGMSLADPDTLSIYQLQNGIWTAVFTVLAPGTSLCTHVTSLGTFAIFYSAVPTTAISTIAGTGFGRNSIDGPGGDPRDDANDGGPATDAALTPTNGTLDRTRNLLYVADNGGGIRRIDLQTGIISTVPATVDPNAGVGGMALDSVGDLYFISGCQVRKYSFSTQLTTAIAGNGTCGFAGDGADATLAEINPFLGQLAFDTADNLFIADSQNARVRRVSGGVITTIAGDGTFQNPVSGSIPTQTPLGAYGLAFDHTGALLISDELQIMRVTPAPGSNLIVGAPGEQLNVVAGCVVLTGPCLAPFGGDGGPAISAYELGEQISVAGDGAVLVTDQIHTRVRRIDPGADGVVTGAADEIIWTVAGFSYVITNGIGIFNGDTYSTQATLAAPAVVLEDSHGNLLILDSNNNRIRMTGYSPKIPGGHPSATGADLSVAASASPVQVNINDTITYGPIIITNAGPQDATGTKLNLTLPAQVTFSSITTDTGTCSTPAVGSSGTVSCYLGTLVNGASAQITVTVTTQASGTAAASITATSSVPDPNTSNNGVTLSTTINSTVDINIPETITVADAPSPLPSAMIAVPENITVADAPIPLPSAMIAVPENVTVTDAPTPVPAAMISVPENITVADAPSPVPLPSLTTATSGTGSGNLSVTPAGTSCGPNCMAYSPGTTVTITATAASGSSFAGFTGGSCGNTNPCVTTLSASETIVASFSLNEFQVKTAVTGTGSGTVTLTPPGDSCGPNCMAYAPGTQVTITAAASLGSSFTTFSGEGCANANPCIFTISASGTITTTFTRLPGAIVPAGAGVTVTLLDAGNNPLPIQLTFSSVTTGGLALGSIVNPPPRAPSGYKFLSQVFDITSTAAYTGPITVCFLGNGFLPQDQLWHAGALIGAVTRTNTMVCATVVSLSPFGVVEPSYQVRLLYDSNLAKKSGSAYPIKIQLTDADGNNLSSSAVVVHAVSVTQTNSNTPLELDDSGDANPDFDFRYDPSLAGYIFNLSTTGYTTGTYRLNFFAGLDPSVHPAPFAVK